jgi:hypothetical protein
VPTASAGAAPSAANPLAASTARIVLRISNLLIPVPRLAGSIFINTSRTHVLQSSHSALQYRCEAECEFFTAGSSAKFRKTPAAQH